MSPLFMDVTKKMHLAGDQSCGRFTMTWAGCVFLRNQPEKMKPICFCARYSRIERIFGQICPTFHSSMIVYIYILSNYIIKYDFKKNRQKLASWRSKGLGFGAVDSAQQLMARAPVSATSPKVQREVSHQILGKNRVTSGDFFQILYKQVKS